MAYELELPDSFKIHPVFHTSLLKPNVVNPFPGHEVGPPEAIMVDGEEEFEIKTIIDCRRRQGQNQYLIKWKGFGPKENSWEPEANLHAPRLVQAFHRSHPERRAQMGIRGLHVRRGNFRELSQMLVPVRQSDVRQEQVSPGPGTHISTLLRTSARESRCKASYLKDQHTSVSAGLSQLVPVSLLLLMLLIEP